MLQSRLSTEKTTGIILKTRYLTETSLIVYWLTRDFGRLTTVARGARRPKSPYRGKIDLFYLAELTFRRSRRSDLHTLYELSLVQPRLPLPRTVPHLQQAAYASHLVEALTETETPIPELFDLFEAFLRYLGTHAPAPLTVFAFEVKLLRLLGLGPDTEHARPDAGELVEALARPGWNDLPSPSSIPDELGLELKAFLSRCLEEHLEFVPPPREAAIQSAQPR